MAIKGKLGEQMAKKETKEVVEVKSEETKPLTKKEIEAFVAEIEKRLVSDKPAYMHSMLGLNLILRQPNLATTLDNELKDQLKDLWLKLIKSTGLQLANPPILFGYPEIQVTVDDSSDHGATAHQN